MVYVHRNKAKVYVQLTQVQVYVQPMAAHVYVNKAYKIIPIDSEGDWDAGGGGGTPNSRKSRDAHKAVWTHK